MLWLASSAVYGDPLTLCHKANELFHILPTPMYYNPEVFGLFSSDSPQDSPAFFVPDYLQTYVEAICLRAESIEVFWCTFDASEEVSHFEDCVEHAFKLRETETHYDIKRRVVCPQVNEGLLPERRAYEIAQSEFLASLPASLCRHPCMRYRCEKQSKNTDQYRHNRDLT